MSRSSITIDKWKCDRCGKEVIANPFKEPYNDGCGRGKTGIKTDLSDFPLLEDGLDIDLCDQCIDAFDDFMKRRK